MAAAHPFNLGVGPRIQPLNPEPNQPPIQPQRKPRLSDIERQEIVQFILLHRDADGSKKRGIMNELAHKYDKSRQTISALWSKAKKQMETQAVINVRANYKGRCGGKKKNFDLSRLRGLPYRKRTTIRRLAKALKISKSTIGRLIKKGEIRSHSSAFKPFITEANIKKRLEFCLSKLVYDETQENPSFQDCFDQIHIDEKWFYMSKEGTNYYLDPNEPEPVRKCKSKNFIAKVMFLAVVARPRFGPSGEVIFDGKLGIFPFTFVEPAKRKSKNRAAGTLETKPIASITKQVIKDTLINKVLPVIKEKWPQGERSTIYIQQDNARPHISPTDPEFMLAASEGGWDIQLCNQPANSPDLNVLDLGFFSAIQSLQNESTPTSVAQLVQVVKEAFQMLEAETLNKVWLSLQYCMNEVIKCKGNNTYKVPHAGKDSLIRQGLLPLVVNPSITDVNEAILGLTVGQIIVANFTETDDADLHGTVDQEQFNTDIHLQG